MTLDSTISASEPVAEQVASSLILSPRWGLTTEGIKTLTRYSNELSRQSSPPLWTLNLSSPGRRHDPTSRITSL